MPYNFNYFDHLIDELPHLNRRKLANNTYVRRLPDDTLAIRLHDTDIIIVRPDDTFLLQSGGWRTYTTKDRINRFSPARLYQEKNHWYVWPGPTPFFEGVIVDMQGNPLNADDGKAEAAIAAEKNLEKMIHRMIRKLRACEELPEPNGGDCWGCCMVAESKRDRVGRRYGMKRLDPHERPLGGDCVWSHLEEGYLHGSLIIRAMEWAGFQPAGISIYWQSWTTSVWSKETVVRAMRRFLRHEGKRILAQREEIEHAV